MLTTEQRDQLKARAVQRYLKNPEKVIIRHRTIVEEAGAVYEVGMMGDLVLFTSLQTGSTLALPEKDLTVLNVRRHVAESNAKFGIKEAS